MTDDLFSVAGVPLEPVPLFVGPVSKHPLYRVRTNMIARCHTPSNAAFADYGGRGIFVCHEWLKSSRAFISWALANGWKPGLEIDRRDNDGPYAPWNCRFVTRVVNARNKRNNLRLRDGSSMLAYCERHGLSRPMIYQRMHRGMSVDEAVAIPRTVRPLTTVRLSDGRPLRQAYEDEGVRHSWATVTTRISRGWSPEDALFVPVDGKKGRGLVTGPRRRASE